jgi:hypothetical protein
MLRTFAQFGSGRRSLSETSLTTTVEPFFEGLSSMVAFPAVDLSLLALFQSNSSLYFTRDEE